MRKDYAVVLRPLFAKEADMWMAAHMASKQLGKPLGKSKNFPHDFNFNLTDIKSFYCSELVWWAYNKAMGVSPFKPREIFGHRTIAPQDFLDAKKKFRVVLASESFSQLPEK